MCSVSAMLPFCFTFVFVHVLSVKEGDCETEKLITLMYALSLAHEKFDV